MSILNAQPELIKANPEVGKFVQQDTTGLDRDLSPTSKKLFNGIKTIPCVKKKAMWALKWVNDNNASYIRRLIALACVEGIFFSGRIG